MNNIFRSRASKAILSSAAMTTAAATYLTGVSFRRQILIPQPPEMLACYQYLKSVRGYSYSISTSTTGGVAHDYDDDNEIKMSRSAAEEEDDDDVGNKAKDDVEGTERISKHKPKDEYDVVIEGEKSRSKGNGNSHYWRNKYSAKYPKTINKQEELPYPVFCIDCGEIHWSKDGVKGGKIVENFD